MLCVMDSTISAYERRRTIDYLWEMITSGERNGLRHAVYEDVLPEWLAENADLLGCEPVPEGVDWTRARLKQFLRPQREQAKKARKDGLARHLHRFARMAGLSNRDRDIAEALIRYKTQPLIESLFDQVDKYPSYIFSLRNPVLGAALGISRKAVQERVGGNMPLMRSGLVGLDSDGDLAVAKRWKLLANAPEDADLTRLLLGEPAASELEWSDFDHLGADRRLALELLQGAVRDGAAGVNLLLEGPPGSGKTEFAKVLGAELGANVFGVGEADDDGDEPSRLERLQELRSAQLLARDGKSVLLFDEMDDVLTSDADWLWRMPLFSSPARGSEGSKVYLNRALEQAPVPTIWTVNDARSVSPVILRRMMFVLRMRVPPARVRAGIWRRQFERHGVTVPAATAAEMAREFAVTPGVAEGAIRAVGLTGSGVDEMRRMVSNLVSVLPGASGSGEAELPERYDPALINADTDLTELAERLVASDSRCFSLLVSGAAGTGKSAYVRYLAGCLGMPVLQKRVSDLASPYAGETEQKIAAAFNEAISERAFLVLDEADSILADRRRAHWQWEITEVNEMLTWMERHPLPFACTTNMAALLDPATLRRFLFKVKLDYLTSAQAEAAFKLYFDQPAPPEVAELANLTPADFDVVRKQAEFRGCLREPARLAELLRAECQAKPGRNAPLGFATVHSSCRQKREP